MKFKNFPIFLSLLVVVIVPCVAIAQEIPNCPNLEVIGPSGITNPGDRMTFVLQFASTDMSPKEIRWTVDVGAIVSGQGTRSIEVVSEVEASTVTATATVSGFPGGCRNTASEKAGVADLPEGQPVDTYGNLPSDDQRGRLDLFFAEMANNPTNTGFVVVSPSKVGDMREVMRRVAFVIRHARFRKFDISRIKFGTEFRGSGQTVLWRVPPGANPPCPAKTCQHLKVSR